MLLYLLIFAFQVMAVSDQPRWVTGVGEATGTDITILREDAINKARKDAMTQCGIVIRSTTILKEDGSNTGSADGYLDLTEASTKGIIIEERNLKLTDPVSVRDAAEKVVVLKVTATLEALVAVEQNAPDPAFQVEVKPSAERVRNGTSVAITVKTTKPSFIYIFSLTGDSLDLLFPNEVSRLNHILPEKPYHFPPAGAYDLELTLPKGQTSSRERFVVVAVKDSVAGPRATTQRQLVGNVRTMQNGITEYGKWLHAIPCDRRTSDAVLVTVIP